MNANKEAKALLAQEERYRTDLQTVEDKLEYLRAIGYEGISDLCMRVMQADDFVFATHRAWSVCALSGETHNRFVVVSGEHGGNFLVFNVHEKFRSFLEALWIICHVQRLQTLRVAEWFGKLNAKQQKMPPAHLIQTFADTREAETARFVAVVERAFAVVNRVLDDTTHKIENSVQAASSI